METRHQTSTKEILNHHLLAFIETDIAELMKDYTDGSELLTPQGPVKSLEGIRSFFEEIFKLVPKGSTLELKQEIIRGNVAYFFWTGESQYVTIPMGTDTFVIDENKILYQTLAAQIIPKQ